MEIMIEVQVWQMRWIWIEFNIIYMSYITYSPNEIVYIKQIGYATLVNCGARNSISQKVEAPVSKRQSIYFDPDLFNSDGDSNNSKKSQNKSDDEKPEKKLVEVVSENNFQEEKSKVVPQDGPKKQQNEIINIVQAKIDGTGAFIYTSEKNLTKTIFVVVKSFIITRKDQIIIQIQISKTIDTLRKQIFQQLGEQISNYYNIKLFATNPSLQELGVQSKTLSQCQIKDNAKLILIADYAFTFRPLAQLTPSKYKVSINTNTIISTKPVQQAKKVDVAVIALPPPPPPVQQQPASGEVKVQQKIVEVVVAEQKKQVAVVVQQKIQKKQQQQKKNQQVKVDHPVEIEDQKSALLQNGPYNAKCSASFSSGKRYWEIKIEKLPVDQDDLIIGVCVESEGKEAKVCWNCDYIWAYQVLSGKKIFIERDKETNTFEQQHQPYGYVIRQNDTIGVLLAFKGKIATLTFYKNSISCGQAFVIQMDSLKEDQRNLVPFLNIGGESQITLDSKALPPLDSYRQR